MSLERQEELLLALLFDEALRAGFERDREAVMSRFELSAEERADFRGLRLGGLSLDAELRRDLVLARLCRSLPLSFSVAAALDPSLALHRSLLSAAYFEAKGHERIVRSAVTLREQALGAQGLDPKQRALASTIFDLEAGLAALSSAAREAAMAGAAQPDALLDLSFGWEARRLRVAPFTGFFLLPRPEHTLRRELCPCPPEALWARLTHMPTPPQRLTQALVEEAPRLFVARAVVQSASRCEATVTQRTMELPAAFGPLLQQLAAGRTVQGVLEALARGGVGKKRLESVGQGLLQLLEQRLLEPA